MEILITIIWNNWLFICIVACFLYAVDNILDNIFIGRNVYVDPVTGTITTCLISSLFLIALFFNNININVDNFNLNMLGIVSGLLYSLYIFFSLKSLHALNDSTNIKTLLGFRVILLPFLAAFLLDENLVKHQYIGIAIAILGVLILSLSTHSRCQTTKITSSIHCAVFLLSISMLIQKQLYLSLDFLTGLTLFMIGRLLGGLLFWLACDTNHSTRIIKKHFLVLLFAKMTGVSALILIQRGICLTPSVTFVAIIECLVPVFIIFLSALLIPFIKALSNNKDLISIFQIQLHQLSDKLMATVFIITGLIVISE